ncbi:MAG: hypothetical protein Greene071421_379 [Parcubacteria group bacterium Greene0714_21]|nr:MAG: hypothetical protein Greene041639_32 [Parcubacteria group bacterium Greene0416_39]TSC98362.1 MAG: hypothetical protein Greene101447_105 [Parcubacteria group bacterium Greene1014_47]TSD04013.1 MAG: hypothetical protein Greene071421_379 [Parcubacteria group bacterium Greene0714_21]
MDKADEAAEEARAAAIPAEGAREDPVPKAAAEAARTATAVVVPALAVARAAEEAGNLA